MIYPGTINVVLQTAMNDLLVQNQDDQVRQRMFQHPDYIKNYSHAN